MAHFSVLMYVTNWTPLFALYSSMCEEFYRNSAEQCIDLGVMTKETVLNLQGYYVLGMSKLMKSQLENSLLVEINTVT